MKLLALDASTEALSVAILDTRRPRHAREYFEIAPQRHARRLLPLATQLLAEAGWSMSALDGLAFGRGPGAFTGVRIAAGLIQGLAAGLDRPVMPVSTLAAIAYGCFAVTRSARALVIQDARMGEVYTAEFARREPNRPRLLGAERVIAPARLPPAPGTDTALGGNGWAIVAEHHAHGGYAVTVEWPHARDIAVLAAHGLAAGEGVPAARALPVYVRDDVARKPAPRT